MLKRLSDELDTSEMSCAVRAAMEADLVYLTDEAPGIRRVRSGRGFSYRSVSKSLVKDEDTLARIKSLVIPPAWTDVWISPDENGHIQATGRDIRGRKQYRYHPRWSVCRGEAKFSSLAAFADALPDLREQVDRDLRRHGLPREKVVASVVWLLDNTMIRVGNSAYARDNKSFGLTTLRTKHVAVEGSTLRFAFKGKSGKDWSIRLTDRRLARILRQIQELPGQQLFQYVSDTGERRSIGSSEINAYIRESSGQDFTSKHFRTWGATIHAASLLQELELPETKTQRNRVLTTVIDTVAARLNNTRTVCRSCYIHPRVIEQWETGTLADDLKRARGRRKAIAGLDEEEGTVRHWLAALHAG